MDNLENTNIDYFNKLIIPCDLKALFFSNKSIINLVQKTRTEISNIIKGHDKRQLFIVGPCSIHNIEDAKEYGLKLKKLADAVSDKILIVMRVYFEKPRTTIGWKGLINDPDLNETYDVNKGLKLARELLLFLNNIGLPCGYEILDTITPQYICDLISWGAIGARTAESQVHRQIVSGLSMPVGFKNSTNGNVDVAISGVKSSQYKHCFMGITDNGEPTICNTLGNKNCHIILRGSNKRPNYYSEDIIDVSKKIKDNNLNTRIMVDCSHGNSNKNYKNQSIVLHNIENQITQGNKHIMGVMLESNLYEGSQTLTKNNYDTLAKGVSITDSCIGFRETENIIMEFYNSM